MTFEDCTLLAFIKHINFVVYCYTKLTSHKTVCTKCLKLSSTLDWKILITEYFVGNDHIKFLLMPNLGFFFDKREKHFFGCKFDCNSKWITQYI